MFKLKEKDVEYIYYTIDSCYSYFDGIIWIMCVAPTMDGGPKVSWADGITQTLEYAHW
jgi:hypothetical protein